MRVSVSLEAASWACLHPRTFGSREVVVMSSFHLHVQVHVRVGSPSGRGPDVGTDSDGNGRWDCLLLMALWNPG